jgi:hypothetical protein
MRDLTIIAVIGRIAAKVFPSKAGAIIGCR